MGAVSEAAVHDLACAAGLLDLTASTSISGEAVARRARHHRYN
jgi:hypothetical protein